MVLLSKDEINKIIENIGFSIDKKVDEHITDVGIGKEMYIQSDLENKPYKISKRNF